MSKPHTPTPENRVTAENAAGLGISHEHIAVLLQISEPTLRRRYKRELALGKAKSNVNVAQMMYKRCLAGSDAMLRWWSQTQMGWKPPPVELGGPGGGPLIYAPAAPELLRDYYAKIAESAAAAPADPAAAGFVGPRGQSREEPEEGEDFSPR